MRPILAVMLLMLNLIPFNAVDGSQFRRPSWDQVSAMARQLHARGVLTKLRRSAGQDVEAGCGQLRARATEKPVVLRAAGAPQ